MVIDHKAKPKYLRFQFAISSETIESFKAILALAAFLGSLLLADYIDKI